MYELKIKDSNGIWQTVDLDNETIAINYQVNNVAELKDRQANYSQEIKLPKSKKNISILEFCNVFESDTSLPYKSLECRLYSNSLELAGKGSILVINSIDNTINCQILSGNADLFERMDGNKIEDLDKTVLGYTIIGQSNNVPSWVKWAMCCVGQDWKNVNVAEHFYFINLYKIVEKLVNKLGYNLITNLSNEDKNKIYFNIASLKPLNPYSLNTFYVQAESNVERNIPHNNGNGYWYNAPINIISNGNGIAIVQGGDTDTVNHGTEKNDNIIQNTAKQLIFYSNITGTIKIKVDIQGAFKYINTHYVRPYNNYWFNYYSFDFVILQNDEILYDTNGRAAEVVSSNINIHISKEISVEEGDVIKIMLACWIPNASGDISYAYININNGCIEITEETAEVVPEGGKLFFQNNTGFDTYLDLFKTFVQSFGMVTYINNKVDSGNPNLYCYTYKELYENKAKAKDWSSKLAMDKDTTLSFILDNYGQNNFLRMTEKDELEDKGNFYVDNTNLEKWKDLFTLKWEAGEDVGLAINSLINEQGAEVLVTVDNVAKIPIKEWEEDDNSTSGYKEKFKEGKPHLVMIDSNNKSNHLFAQNLIDKYYLELSKYMLNKAKKIEVYLNLKDMDIENFEPFIPIYLKQFGAYFYINKITNYISGQLTKVELIKM